VELVHEVVASLAGTPPLQARLAAAFERLLATNGVQPVLDAAHKARFRDNLERFLVDVRGFLRMR
jgi:hypothetical protein